MGGTQEFLPNETRPATHFRTQNQERIQVKTGDAGHKCLGCILGVGLSKPEFIGFITSPSGGLSIFLCGHTNSLWPKGPCEETFTVFRSCHPLAAMSGSGHRRVYHSDLRGVDVLFRRLLRMVVGAPGNLDWSRQGSDINLKQTSCETMGTLLFRIALEPWIVHLLLCLEKGGSKELCVGNPLVHVLQDIVNMIGHQNFNRKPRIDTWMFGILWHPPGSCGHTWLRISWPLLPASFDEEQRAFCRIFFTYYVNPDGGMCVR